MSEQLNLFEVENVPNIEAAHYMKLWDEDGLIIDGLADNWYPYRSGNETARAKSYNKVKRRLDQLTSTGLVGHAEIVTTESRMAEYQYAPEPLTLKHYPNSTVHLSE